VKSSEGASDFENGVLWKPLCRCRHNGFSRPSFYQAQALFEQGGLPGLLPQRPGPKRAHKLSEAVVDLLEAMLAEDPTLNSRRLAQLLEEQLGLRTHPRSVERALDRRRRKRGLQPPS
jgi:transposase